MATLHGGVEGARAGRRRRFGLAPLRWPGRLSWAGRHRRWIVGLAAAVVTAVGLLVVSPEQPAPPSSGPPPEVERALTAMIEASAPGVVAAVRDDNGGSWTEAKGYAVLGNSPLPGARDVPMRPGDRFRIGSTTKTFVATLVLQLAGEHRVELDAPLARYLPGLLHDGDRITVRQLLNHTSGLPEAVDAPAVQAAIQSDSVLPPTDWVRIADGMPRTFPPGSGLAYSSTNYQVLGLLLEHLTGQPLARQLDDRLFRPLGLTATSFEPEPTSQTWPTGVDVAHGYLPGWAVPGAGAAPVDASVHLGGGAWAAGALVSNAADLTRFFGALLSGRLLDRSLLAQMMTALPGDIPEGDGYGLGLIHYTLSCGAAWGHGGLLPPYTASVLTTPDGSRTAVVLLNGVTGTPDDVTALGTAMQQSVDRAFCQRS